MKIVLTGIAEPLIENLNSKCNIPIKISLYEKPGVNFLEQNYPNPAPGLSTIRFGITDEGLVSIKVYDLYGHRRMTLMNENLLPGIYEVNSNLGELEDGIYLYTLSIGNNILSKLLVVRK